MIKIADYSILDTTTSTPAREVISYGVKMLDAPSEWRETMGEGIKVGVIDTGVDYNHEDLKGRIKKAANFTKEADYDTNGHGTHVCGIIAANKNNIGVVGVAPLCELYVAKAFGENGNADTTGIYQSIMWLISEGVDVINMSYSSPSPGEMEKYAVNECVKRGIITVAAAGNNGGKNSIMYPAKYEGVIAVTAVDINKKHAEFSSAGKEAYIAAAGTKIISTYKNNSYAVLSGTSMATPLITGAVALLHSKALKRFGRKLTIPETNTVLGIYADDINNNGKDNEYGYGIFSFGRLY